MHRISVFRDDVIFVIYLCQRRMYPVDKARPSEGFDVDDDGTGTAEVAAPAPTAADFDDEDVE
jgi:hypothetical protein